MSILQRTPKAVLFDLDGLLINSEIVWYQLYQDLLGPYGKGFTLDEYTGEYCGRTAKKNLTDIVNRFELPMTPDEAIEFCRTDELKYLERGIPLKDGALELIQTLRAKGTKVILATSSIRGRAVGILEKDKVFHLFDDGVYGPEVPHSKPAPDVFLIGCQKAGVAPEDALVLEDSEAGILAANAAGIPVICIPDLKQPSDKVKKGCAAVLPSLRDVIPLV